MTAAATVLDRCDVLAGFTEEPGRLTRRFATPALRAAGDAVEGWMREAGMEVRRDAIGNVIGRLDPAADPRAGGTLIMGSHLDTVRDAGRYDGMLGVLVALAALEGRRLPYAVEVIGFADEEGVRYQTAYLGSGVVAGRFDPALLDRRDADGMRMADAIRDFGGDPDSLAAARRDGEGLLGYVETHIEQGPVLESRDLPVGVVEAIAGQTRARVGFTGVAGHAGTVPMDLRRDALAGAAEWIAAVEAAGRDPEGAPGVEAAAGEAATASGLVATVGEISVEPGAANVIPGLAELTLDVRHRDDGVREAAVARLRAAAEEIAGRRGLTAAWAVVQETPAVACSPELTERLAAAVADAGHDVERLSSGAGHDAAVMSTLAPVAMLFVRCAGGISHNPAEAVAEEDVAAAIDVLGRFLDGLGR